MAQLVSIPPAGVSIEEPGGARDLPQFNTHSAHNSTLSDVMGRVRRAKTGRCVLFTRLKNSVLEILDAAGEKWDFRQVESGK